ncbi:hypothetical protein [Winogradskyella sp. SYSU M77433]|uniref:hypothetical protein n=1 Tax=Winogradskyella sp. SYSU M77433 TaxID=3042722 RepID=UPI0024806A99|nr:hypothetical protein [Winogradskyella sp. SYSU M77433]MDH7913933.1 hypothetical protein [Winogradskyella sp. SYSU M77433]
MKLKINLVFICLFLLTISINGQVSVGPTHIGKQKKFPKDRLDKFKGTETIFVLSDIIDTATYKKLLSDSWDITPYKLISREDFNLLDYLDGNYSFANLEGYHKQKQMKSGAVVDYIYVYVNFFMLDSEGLKKDISKLDKSKKKYERKLNNAISSNRENIARVDLFPKDTFLATALTSETSVIMDSIYTRDVFYNYKSGFLKNYFQKVNNQIGTGEEYWMYDNDFLPELKKLANETLYIPNYHLIKYNPWKMKAKEDKDEFQDTFENYNYKFEFQDENEIDRRILNGEEFYYLRFVRVNSQKFIHIINSKTGEIIYRNYVAGMLSSYNMKARHVKDINSCIKKALKR